MIRITTTSQQKVGASWLAAIIESAHDAIVTKSLDGILTTWNPAAEQLYGYSAQEAIGRHITLLVPPDRLDEEKDILERISRGERVERLETVRLRKNGAVVKVQVTISPIRDAAGHIVGASHIAHDITERKTAEAEMLRHATRLAALHRSAGKLSAQLNLTAVLKTVCAEAALALNVPIAIVQLYDEERDAFEYSESVGLSPGSAKKMQLLPRAGYESAYRRAGLGALTSAPDLRAADLPNADLFNEADMRSSVAAPLQCEGRVLGLLTIATVGAGHAFDAEELGLLEGFADLAGLAIDNAQLFRSVSTGRGRLRALSQQLLEVQEAERRLIARQLHDEIGQALTAVKISLRTLQTMVDQPVRDQLDDSIRVVEDTLERARSLSVELRPAMLDDLGLAAALRWYADRQAQRAGFQVHVTSELAGERLPPAVETACFRVTQEALTNVVRHACAQHVEIKLRRDCTVLELAISDDGVGFDVPAALAKAARGESLGLLSMQERAVLAGGELGLESGTNRGSRLCARFPLDSPVAAPAPAAKHKLAQPAP